MKLNGKFFVNPMRGDDNAVVDFCLLAGVTSCFFLLQHT